MLIALGRTETSVSYRCGCSSRIVVHTFFEVFCTNIYNCTIQPLEATIQEKPIVEKANLITSINAQKGKFLHMDAFQGDDLDQMTSEVMRYILFHNFKDPNVPIRREELTEIVSKVHKSRRGFPSAVIENAKTKFLSIFGLELKELTKLRSGKSTTKSQGSELINLLISIRSCYRICFPHR